VHGHGTHKTARRTLPLQWRPSSRCQFRLPDDGDMHATETCRSESDPLKTLYHIYLNLCIAVITFLVNKALFRFRTRYEGFKTDGQTQRPSVYVVQKFGGSYQRGTALLGYRKALVNLKNLTVINSSIDIGYF
jgi:hypothetical protein